MKLNSRLASVIAAAMRRAGPALGLGASAALVAGIVASATGAGAAVGVVTAAVLGVGIGLISHCALRGHGIYLNQLWTGVPFCAGQ